MSFTEIAAPSATGTVSPEPRSAVASAPVKLANTSRVFRLIVMLGTLGREEHASGAGPDPLNETVGWSVAAYAGAVGPAGPDRTNVTSTASSTIHTPVSRRGARWRGRYGSDDRIGYPSPARPG